MRRALFQLGAECLANLLCRAGVEDIEFVAIACEGIIGGARLNGEALDTRATGFWRGLDARQKVSGIEQGVAVGDGDCAGGKWILLIAVDARLDRANVLVAADKFIHTESERRQLGMPGQQRCPFTQCAEIFGERLPLDNGVIWQIWQHLHRWRNFWRRLQEARNKVTAAQRGGEED